MGYLFNENLEKRITVRLPTPEYEWVMTNGGAKAVRALIMRLYKEEKELND